MHRSIFLAVAVCALFPLISAAAEEAPIEQKPVDQLVETLSQPDAPEALPAIDEVGRRGESAKAAVPALIKALASKLEVVRWHAARALGALGPAATEAVPALTAALGDEQANVRAYAAFALGAVGKDAEPAVERLLETVLDKEALVRRASMRALRQIGPDPAKALPVLEKILEEADPALVQSALHTMAERGKEAVPRLQQFLKRPKLAYWACVVLAELGPDGADAVPELTEVLKSEEPDVRLHAVMALAAIGEAAKPTVPQLTALLEKDPFEGVRYAAVYALVTLGERTDAVNGALAHAAEHKDPLLKLLGLWGLAKLNPDDKELAQAAAEAIVADLKSEDPKLRQAAARALNEFHGPPEIVRPALIAALKDADPQVVGHALDALASLGPKVLDKIDQALQEPTLRHYATRLIFRLGEKGAPAVPALIEVLKQPTENEDDLLFRREVQYTLAAIGPGAKDAVPELIRSLASEDEEVFGTACYALGKIGPTAGPAVPALKKQWDERQDAQRVVIAWTLLKIMPNAPKLQKFAAPLLIRALNSERELARAEAARTLGELGELAKPAIPRLKELLEDESPMVRDSASAALQKLGGE
jgi:HEAT repeat protein